MICENLILSAEQYNENHDSSSAAESLNAVKLYITENYEMLLIVTISTVEREKKVTTKNNNIKGESSIALSERLIPIIFQETSISSRRHPHSAKDFKEKKIKQKK